MIYLLLSIVFSTLIFVIFKYFDVFKIDTLKAIIVNYVVAFILGFVLAEIDFSVKELPNLPGFLGQLRWVCYLFLSFL